MRRKRLADKPTRHKPEPVETTRVSPLLMALALQSADGDASRIHILGPHEVLVLNPRDTWT
jgi:hypothetical protein